MADESNKVVAEPRDSFGKGAARKIRAAGKIPAVVYGHGTDPQHLELDGHDREPGIPDVPLREHVGSFAGHGNRHDLLRTGRELDRYATAGYGVTPGRCRRVDSRGGCNLCAARIAAAIVKKRRIRR